MLHHCIYGDMQQNSVQSISTKARTKLFLTTFKQNKLDRDSQKWLFYRQAEGKECETPDNERQ